MRKNFELLTDEPDKDDLDLAEDKERERWQKRKRLQDRRLKKKIRNTTLL